MKYRCLNCGKEMEMDFATLKKVICSYCGYRILEKIRPKIVKKVDSN